MRCPLCSGEHREIHFSTEDGSAVNAKKCDQCSGIWFPSPLGGILGKETVEKDDIPSPNYSTKAYDLICPLDGTLLQSADHDVSPHSGQYWTCPDCDGMFFPKGQLALHQNWLRSEQETPSHQSAFSRIKVTVATLSIFVLTVAVFASLSKVELQAAQVQALPNSGPNFLTLILLAVTYIAGTILAVLGRRLPVIFMGWSVIVICLFGFSVIIFGP